MSCGGGGGRHGHGVIQHVVVDVMWIILFAALILAGR